ncbi:MAG: hypothetical protein H6Q06_1635 [Acidobacteria bacterium]|jgi:hypothetical protein|nr:hypothetical protein [Acidobacteriota bacterium]
MESKNMPAPIDIPTELKDLSCQIEQWRRTRPHRMPMPEPLWVLATNLARQHGLARVARLVRLDYYCLKNRIESLHEGNSATSVAKPTFIELPPLPVNPVSECTIELEHPRGRRMRIHMKGAPMPDVTALSRTLWGMKS